MAKSENGKEAIKRHAAILARHGISEEQFQAILAEAKPARREWRKYQCHLTPAQVAQIEETFGASIELRIANPSH